MQKFTGLQCAIRMVKSQGHHVKGFEQMPEKKEETSPISEIKTNKSDQNKAHHTN
jgi:hypothetical protein